MRDREHALGVVRHHLDDIRRTGTLELRKESGRTPGYCLRFRCRCPTMGTVRQRRLAMGDDPEINEIVRDAIVERISTRLRAKAAKAEAAKRRKQARADEAEFMTFYPGSRSYRRQVRQAYRRSLVSGKEFLLEFYWLLASQPRRKRPGRPPKSRLW